MAGTETCDVSECNGERSVCSIGTVRCDSCFDTGYSVQTGKRIGLCSGVLPLLSMTDCNSFFLLTVIDVDECFVPELNNCEQYCNNTDGSYHCSCDSGFTLLSDGFQCEGTLKCPSSFSNSLLDKYSKVYNKVGLCDIIICLALFVQQT